MLCKIFIFSCMLLLISKSIFCIACCAKSIFSLACCAKSKYSLACCAKSVHPLACFTKSKFPLVCCGKSIYSLACCGKFIYCGGACSPHLLEVSCHYRVVVKAFASGQCGPGSIPGRSRSWRDPNNPPKW